MITYVFHASEPSGSGLDCVANITVYPPCDTYQSQIYTHVVITQLTGDYMFMTLPPIVKYTLFLFLGNQLYFSSTTTCALT